MFAQFRQIFSAPSEGMSSYDTSSGSSNPSSSSSTPPPRPAYRRSLNFDVDARVTVRAPRANLNPQHFSSFGPFFRPAYVGPAHVADLNAFLVGLMTLELQEVDREDQNVVYQTIFQETITLEGPSAYLPRAESSFYRDSFRWRRRGELYYWTIYIDQTLTPIPGVGIETLARPHGLSAFRPWEVSFIEDGRSHHWIPIRTAAPRNLED
ncbi:ORF1 [Tacheng Tick Virus 3]|uniref:ORF1 n=1 Tax=Tacheng Tick Virus 3 TaxID=1608085 RepID=UPI0005AD2C86|nr:ORF1 [Tacheng Tick Virus 3]AJG39137.1 ORF1 [Tacheng Tick Virus 3]